MEKKIELDKEFIKSSLLEILNKSHSIREKRVIITHDDKFNFSCPICGDSNKNATKRRGNLYFKNLYYVCYNNSECSCSFTKLLKTFDVEMDLDKKLELYDYLDSIVSYKVTDDVQFDNLNKLFNVNDLILFYNDEPSRGITDLKPLVPNSVVDNYVRNVRKIKHTTNIYQAFYHFSDKWKQPVMVFMNKANEKVISLQVRNILGGDKRFFKIYDFSKIYNELYPSEELDDQERISYDKLSHFYNIFNVDFTRTVTLFEGYIDSLFLPNSIGMIGVNTDLTFLLKEEGIDLRFIFDNDASGNKKTKSMLSDRHNVFLWNKFFMDVIQEYKGGRPIKDLINKLKSIKDFNQLALLLKKPIHIKYDINKYFSNDDLDDIYLMDLSKVYDMYKENV